MPALSESSALNPRVRLPAVLRSRHDLAEKTPEAPPRAIPITASGVTYTMAQEVAWVDLQHFAVGRWDGTLSLFRFTDSPTSGPLIADAVNSPASEGVQMITWLAPRVFATSNDDSSIVVWSSPSGSWTDLMRVTLLKYDASYGVANSGDSMVLDGRLCFVAGHANGFASIWTGAEDGSDLELVTAVNLRSPQPVNPWGLHNIRGLSTVFCEEKQGYVVTGSEDGDICLVQVPDGTVLSRTVYNAAAQRGINYIAIDGLDLLVANCSVGPDDKNLWYFRVDPQDWSIRLQDATDLKVEPAAPQVFNFCVLWARHDGRPCFFSSTEEGALWMGTLRDGRLSLIGYAQVTTRLGAAMAFNSSGNLIVVGHDLYEFGVETPCEPAASAHPERLRLPTSER